MAKARAGDDLDVFTDDLLLEIFARVRDVLDLLRCAGTCIKWFRLISCPAFLRRLRLHLLPDNEARHASFLVGAFWQHTVLASSMESGPRISQCPPQFYGLDTLPVGGTSLTFTSFIPNNDGVFNYAVPVTSRRGLLLARILPTSLNRRKLHLAVCHLLIGERSTILVPPPPLELNPDDNISVPVEGAITGYALFTAADNCIHGDLGHPQRLAFQVLFTGVHSGRLVYAYSYSSTTGSWSAPLKCPQPSSFTMCGPRTGVVTRGFAHWVYTDDINFYSLSIWADATAVSLTKIPIQIAHRHHMWWRMPLFPCIIGEGQLSFVNQRLDNGVLELWTMREQGHDHSHEYEGEWVCTELMSEEASKGIQIVSFLDGRGAMLLRKREQHCLFTLDLDTKKLEPVMWGEDSRLCKEYSKNHVPYEMDWSSYLLQLTAMNQGGAIR